MDNIKFRGNSVATGEWLYGVPIPNSFGNKTYMVCLIPTDKIAYPVEKLHEFCHEVIPETVGQFTGLKDKNGVEIYEGDVFRGKSGFKVVKFKGGSFVVEYKFNIRGYEEVSVMPLITTSRESEVIGNIYENPELLGA